MTRRRLLQAAITTSAMSSMPGAESDPTCGEFYALDHELPDFQHFSREGGPFRRRPICILRADDGGPVLYRSDGVSRDEGFEPRRDGASFGRVAGNRFV